MMKQALRPAEDLAAPPPRARAMALLRRMIDIAEPGRGAPRILLLLAHLARCSWLEGGLVVRLWSEGAATRLELLADDGISSERLCPVATIRAPLAEFLRAVQLKPQRVLPLLAEAVEPEQLVLRAEASTGDPDALDAASETLLAPEREARPDGRGPAIEWSRSARSGTNPTPDALTSAPKPPRTPPAPNAATSRMPAQQAAELVARIKLKKQGGAVSEISGARPLPRDDKDER